MPTELELTMEEQKFISLPEYQEAARAIFAKNFIKDGKLDVEGKEASDIAFGVHLLRVQMVGKQSTWPPSPRTTSIETDSL